MISIYQKLTGLWVLMLICCANALPAQNHHDNIWLFSALLDRGSQVDFSSGEPVVQEVYLPVEFENGSTTMSDSKGRLAFYTEGCTIYSWDNTVMENGDSLNPGTYYEEFCNLTGLERRGYPGPYQSTISLPWPAHNDKYLLLHNATDRRTIPVNGSYHDNKRFYVTTIDMAANEGRGKVTSKNVLTDLRSKEGEQNPIRHANGHDWWVIAPMRDTNQYALYLVDSSGVSLHSIQEIGNVDSRFDRGGGQSTFTPMGDMYLRYHSNRGMQIFDFDRSTGQLSNFRFVEMPIRDRPTVGWGGLGISPNGRFAYASNIYYIFQYDLWADDIAASRVQVGEVGNPDSLWIGVAPTATNFQLGPDCKLYNFTNTGFKHHVIHNPDEKGRACDWEQNWLVLPTNGFRDIPFFPNFRLGPLGKEGSPCANPIVSTRPDPPSTLQHLTVFPNPTQGEVSLSLSDSFPYARSVWQLFDGRGQLVRREVLSRGGLTRTEGLQLPAGMYFWQLTGSGRTLGQGKLVIR